MRAFDIGAVLSLDELDALKAEGFDGVVPYIDPFNPKGCTTDYLRDIARAGLVVPGFFFETTGGPVTYFTRDQGRRDAWQVERALGNFRREGLVPESVIVWYADDTHLNPPSLFDEYANGIEDVATAHQRPGAYGWQDLGEWMRELVTDDTGTQMRYRFMGAHFAQTYGDDPPPPEVELHQHWQGDVAGITVDADDVRVPGWVPGEGMDDMTEEEARAIARDEIAKYGVALEAELTERLAANTTGDVAAAIAGALTAVSTKLAS